MLKQVHIAGDIAHAMEIYEKNIEKIFLIFLTKV
jgi:hypothetical protein